MHHVLPNPLALSHAPSKIRERLFRRARLLFNLRKRVGEGNNEFAVTLALVLRQCENAGKIVVVGRLLLF